MEKGPSLMQLVDGSNGCDYFVKIFDKTGCPVLSMPAFTIFIDQWPWMIAFVLIALGAYMLIFGRRNFTRVLKLFSSLVMFSICSCLLSINGGVEEKIAEGPSGSIICFIILILSLGLVAGFCIGSKISHKIGLSFMCFVNALILSLLIYAFLMTFTGTWIVLMISTIILIAVCLYLPRKYEQQMQIQTTSFLGSWMLTRGLSLLIGGYPNEMQMIMYMNAGYVLSTENFFFFYFVAIALLFLIG